MTKFQTKAALIALFAGLVACNGGGDGDDGTDGTDGDGGEECESGIAETFPAADATGVFYRTAIDVTFNQDETSTATMSLADAGGTDVPGTTTFSDDGTIASYELDAPLTPSTQYTLTVNYSCDKTAEVSFTTSDIGATVDGSSVIDNVYNIDLFSGRITEPPGVGDIIQGLLEGEDIAVLVSPTDYDDTAMEMPMIGALGEDDGTGNYVQDICTETINFPIAADYAENPFFSIAGEEVPISAAGVDLTIDSISVSGAFAPDGESIGGVAVEVFIDTRPLGELLDLGDEENAVCDLIASFGVSCVDCGNGDAFCLKAVIDNLEAEKQTGTITPRTTAEIEADPTCGGGGDTGDTGM